MSFVVFRSVSFKSRHPHFLHSHSENARRRAQKNSNKSQEWKQNNFDRHVKKKTEFCNIILLIKCREFHRRRKKRKWKSFSTFSSFIFCFLRPKYEHRGEIQRGRETLWCRHIYMRSTSNKRVSFQRNKKRKEKRLQKKACKYSDCCVYFSYQFYVVVWCNVCMCMTGCCLCLCVVYVKVATSFQYSYSVLPGTHRTFSSFFNLHFASAEMTKKKKTSKGEKYEKNWKWYVRTGIL